MNLRALMEEVSRAAEELLPFVTAAAVLMGTGALVAVLAAAAAGAGAALAVMDTASTATLIIGAAAYAVVLAAALRSAATWSGRRGEEGPEERGGGAGGTATLPAGATRVRVEHGLGEQPAAVVLKPRGEPPGELRVTRIDSGGFEVEVEKPPDKDLEIEWRARGTAGKS